MCESLRQTQRVEGTAHESRDDDDDDETEKREGEQERREDVEETDVPENGGERLEQVERRDQLVEQQVQERREQHVHAIRTEAGALRGHLRGV